MKGKTKGILMRKTIIIIAWYFIIGAYNKPLEIGAFKSLQQCIEAQVVVAKIYTTSQCYSKGF
jgi:hypothetical protein